MQLNGREIKEKGSRGRERDNIRYTPVAHYVIPNPIFASGRPTNTLRLVNHTHIFDLLQSNQIESFAGFNCVCLAVRLCCLMTCFYVRRCPKL